MKINIKTVKIILGTYGMGTLAGIAVISYKIRDINLISKVIYGLVFSFILILIIGIGVQIADSFLGNYKEELEKENKFEYHIYLALFATSLLIIALIMMFNSDFFNIGNVF